jgi:hypothetical protein
MLVQFECGTRILRVIQGRDARATLSRTITRIGLLLTSSVHFCYAFLRAMGNERRTDQRVAVNFPVKWHGSSGGHEGRLEDLSVNGCFVNTRGPADVGEIVILSIKLPKGGWLPLRGKVKFHQQLTGFSLSFSILDAKERETLNRLVASQS